ncbi:MAG: galactose-1-phosphate uridylyltransferase [Candidatus Omnitrophica bacterium]|nr:galactose-1-phosphate uridylyltransferase [Candidatus Omnitrophota bacterium]
MNQKFQGKWEERWHPLRREWVVYSAHRDARPWSGASVAPSKESPAYDPACYLCPGNVRARGIRNPDYRGVFIFDNDFPVVGAEAPAVPPNIQDAHPALYQKKRADGIARVVCYDPRHNVTLAQISCNQVAHVFTAWRDQMIEFIKNPSIRFVLIFENRGEITGVSNPHPHCQIYAVNFVFSLIEKELDAALDFHREHNQNIFDEILGCELKSGERVIDENESACAFVPFFARYSYEVMIFPKKRHATLASMSDSELYDLAAVFQSVIRRYDSLFGMPFPYVMSFFQAPVDGGDYSQYHLHLLLQPPLRSPGLQKFLAGPEIGGGNFMADAMPEDKARELKQVDLTSYQGAD